MLTIITPAYRLDLLNKKVRDSIRFEHVSEWIIVYDGTKIAEDFRMFPNEPKIKEYVFRGEGISGNPQRNYALTKVSDEDTFLYYLDDDNIIHPNLYNLLQIATKGTMYAFDQDSDRKAHDVAAGLDTAMMLVYCGACKGIWWRPELYGADGIYTAECYKKIGSCVYIPSTLCYYNELYKMKYYV